MAAPISVELYEQSGEELYGRRSELIRGVVIKKMPPSPEHTMLVEELDELVCAALPEGAHCRQEQPLKLADSMPQPDLAIMPGRRRDYSHSHPTSALLVVEVAVTSVVLDRRKAALYAEASVPECWIVLADEEAVEVYASPQNGRYTRQSHHARAETLTSITLPALSVDLGVLFASE